MASASAYGRRPQAADASADQTTSNAPVILLSGLASRVVSLALFIAMLGVGLGLFYRTAVVRPLGVRRYVWKGTVVALSARK